jgi:mono/diheme cytochrome c family protein
MRERIVAGFAVCLLGGSLAAAQGPKPSAAGKLERGKYLVTGVGMCGDCHTPHDQQGQLVEAEWLKGAPLPFKPTVPMPWAEVAPPIAGLPTMTEAQAVHYLMTSEKPDKTRTRPPMPPYRLSRPDAEAVAAYLKSLQ